MVKTNYMQETFSERIQMARLAFKHTMSEDEIKSQMNVFGYTTERIQDGFMLFNKADEANKAQVQERGEAKDAYSVFEESYSETRSEFSRVVSIVRIALRKTPEKLSKVGLNTKQSWTVRGYIKQAGVFYRNVFKNEDILESMELFGFTKLMLNDYCVEFEKTVSLYDKYTSEKSEGHSATKMRNKAIEELDDWMMDFFAIAKIAFEDNPQVLVKIGVVVGV